MYAFTTVKEETKLLYRLWNSVDGVQELFIQEVAEKLTLLENVVTDQKEALAEVGRDYGATFQGR